LRTADAGKFEPPLLIANVRHGEEILRQLEQVGVAPAAIILEPAARNTAPAIALAALSVPPEDILLVMPSDHVIGDTAAFDRAVEEAVALADRNWLVTLGLTPTHAETGYGYIRQGPPLTSGSFEVHAFVEKPDAETAQGYVSAGNYLWNGGIFVFKPSRFLSELQKTAPNILSAVQAALDAKSTDGTFLKPDADKFGSAPSISVDYAVMEKAEKIAVIPVEMGWSDVGSWDALHDLTDCDAAGNRLVGEVIAVSTSGCSARSEGPLIAMAGVENLTVVATPDAVLILPAGQSHQIKHLLDELKARGSKTLDISAQLAAYAVGHAKDNG
jgi:mannose-1-phosphate guanylyltransferase/mannose-1-phosphate guanylyltransferase/mannose-6-phosphate isomerase